MRARNHPPKSLLSSSSSSIVDRQGPTLLLLEEDVNNAKKGRCNHGGDNSCLRRRTLRCNVWVLLLLSLALVFLPAPLLVVINDSSRTSQDSADNNTDERSLSSNSSAVVIATSALPSPPIGAIPSTTTMSTNHSSSSSCHGFQIPKAVEKDCLMSYLATYPGSGSELCLELIQGMTGIKTGHAYPILKNNSQRQRVVVLKTHYPNKIVRGGHPEHNPVRVTRAIYLVRNPMHALPSFFNFINERKSRQRRHTQQAPVEEWIAWRDEDFSSKLYLWRHHMDYWLSQHHLLQLLPPSSSSSSSSSSSLVLSQNNNNNNNNTLLFDDKKKRGNKTMILVRYEHLIDPTTGPLLLEQMSLFLVQNENVTAVVPSHQMSCLWHYIVVQRRAKKRTKSRYVPPYRNQQLLDMIDLLRWQRSRYQTQYPQLDAMFKDYLDSVQERLRQQQQQQK